MDMFYNPVALRKVTEDIKETHKRIGRSGNTSQRDDELKTLVDQIARAKKSKVIEFVETVLDENDIHKVSGYICYNFWDKDLTNFFIILEHFAKKYDWEVIFTDWQNQYEKKENRENVREFLRRMIKSNLAMQEYIKSQRWQLTQFVWLEDQDVVKALAESCKGYQTLDAYLLALYSNGAIHDTTLAKNCVSQFLLYCAKEAYIQEGVDKLCHNFSMYNAEERNQFCRNFLEVMDFRHLRNMYVLYSSITSRYNDSQIKSVCSEKGFNTFLQWKRAYTVQIAFSGSDDHRRREFWTRYAIEHEIEDYKEVLVIDFGKYVGLEFKKKAAGPIYLLTKEYYIRDIKYRIGGYTTADLRNKLHWEWEAHTEGVCKRIEHRPPETWTGSAYSKLKTYGILPAKI